MQRIVLLSDIHGNLPALQAVAEALPPHDGVFVAGDLCFEGPCPAQVLDFLLDAGWKLVMGNTDRDIVAPPTDGKRLRQERVAWTRQQLGPERLMRLAGLPFSLRLTDPLEEDVLIVHANPRDMDTHLRPTMSEGDLQPYLAGIEARVLAFGHLHIPYIRPVEGVVLADVASVGQPKDGDQRAAFTVISWQDGGRSIEQVRVPYDLEKTIALLHRSDMPGAEQAIDTLRRAAY